MNSIPRAKNFEEISNVAGAVPASTSPMTGDEYIESLHAGREIYLYGDRVKDGTSHPSFRNSVRMTAQLYHVLHDSKTREILTCPTDSGSDGHTTRFFRSARSPKTWWEIHSRNPELSLLALGGMRESSGI